MKIQKHAEIIDNKNVTFYTQNMYRLVSGCDDRLQFDCLNCQNNILGEDDRCNNYISHDKTWGICLNFLPDLTTRQRDKES